MLVSVSRLCLFGEAGSTDSVICPSFSGLLFATLPGVGSEAFHDRRRRTWSVTMKSKSASPVSISWDALSPGTAVSAEKESFECLERATSRAGADLQGYSSDPATPDASTHSTPNPLTSVLRLHATASLDTLARHVSQATHFLFTRWLSCRFR